MSRAAVREALSSCLAAVLTASSEDERRAAEQEMKALEVTEEYGAVLAELTAAGEVGVAYRQLASVLLRQYLECHWSSQAERFSEPVPSEQVKAEIRHLLLASIGDKARNLRATIAYGVAVIAHWDWPEAWPQLLPGLEAALSSGDSDLVHGAMRVLSEFCRDVSDLQLPHVTPVILPQLLRVLLQPQAYSVRTQTRAVNIFHTLASITYATSETTPTIASALLLPALPQFVEAFISTLSCEVGGATDPSLRRELLMTSSSLLHWFPGVMATYVMDLVTAVWKIFVTTTPLYVRGVVNCEGPKSEECDSDGELVTMETCVFAVFEFISSIVENPALRPLLPPILPPLILHLITHMQPTEEQLECWLGDVAQFVEEEEQQFSYSVRLSARDLLQTMWEEPSLRDHTHSAIATAVDKHFQNSRTSSSPHAWKVQEACLLALSCVSMTPASSVFSAQRFTEAIVVPTLACPTAHPILLGRCLWLAGQMAAQLKPGTLQQVLQSLVSALLPTQHSVLRVLAAKAANYFCSELHASDSRDSLLPFLPSLLSLLAAMAIDCPDIVLLVVIDTLQVVARMDEATTAQQAGPLTEVAMDLFLKYSHDPGISSTLEDLFCVLAQNLGCHANLHGRFLPSAVQLLDSNNSGAPLGLVAAMMDVLVLVVRGCGEGGVPCEVVKQVFPRVVCVAMASDDCSLLQNAGECVRAFVAMAMEQLVQWRDAVGESGLGYVVRLAVHLLDPSKPESTAAFVGKLIIMVIKKAGAVLADHLQLLLRSVLSKMQCVKTATVMQSLLMVYAYLLRTQLEAVVSFLCQVPDPHGQPALNYVLQEWTSQHPFFFGVFEVHLSTMALCQLLTHCAAAGDQHMCSLTLYEEGVGQGEGVVTRSQRRGSLQRSKVTLPVKIVRLLVSDLQSHLEEADEGSEEGEEGDGVRAMEALLQAEENCQESEESEDDPDFHDDPLLQLDLHAHLVQYLQELCLLSFFSSTIQPQLRPHELHTLQAAGVHLN